MLEGRLPASPFTLVACVIYGMFALTTAVVRRRAIRTGVRPLDASGRQLTIA